MNIDLLRRSVLAMPVAQTLQLQFRRIEAGDVELELPIGESFSFRPGQLQATAIFAAADVYAVRDGRETLCATWLGSARNLPPAASTTP